MDQAPPPEATAGHQVLVHVHVRDVDRIRVHEVPATSFATSDRGVSLGPLFVPWHRVLRFDQIIHQEFAPEAEIDTRAALVRIVFEDEVDRPHTLEVPLDRFASGTSGVTIVVGDSADETGSTVRKVNIPWHRVISTERVLRVPEAEAGDAARSAPSEPEPLSAAGKSKQAG